MFRRLDERTLVCGQISPQDVAEAAKAGVTMIVNNRPDGESPRQPTSAEIAGAAKDAGVDYRHIPVAGGFSGSQVAAMAEALAAHEGTALIFCTSGTRSVYLWALAKAEEGSGTDDLTRRAAEAGYDLTPLRQYLG